MAYNPRVCPHCGAPIAPWQEKCLSCGEYLWVIK